LDKDLSFDSITDEGLADLICSSQASITLSIVCICILLTACICPQVASTIWSGHPSARAAAAILSRTCSRPFSLRLTASVRQVAIASNAAFTALRVSSESPAAEVGSNLREEAFANVLVITLSPLGAAAGSLQHRIELFSEEAGSVLPAFSLRCSAQYCGRLRIGLPDLPAGLT
jgi:hypothetical protein